jgi:hypothetical protein
MTIPPPMTASQTADDAKEWWRTLALAAFAGLILAIAVAYAYYHDPWRPLAHILAPWAVLATAVAYRRRWALAVGASITSLAVAVVTFYVGLKIAHDIRWADTGSSMDVNWSGVQLWLVFACFTGGVFGLLGAVAPRREWRGATATAVLLGLIVGEAYRRFSGLGPDLVFALDVFLAVAVFAVATRDNRRPALTLILTIGAAVPGFLIVSGPDFIQQLLIEGL